VELTIKEAADHLGVSQDTIRRRIRNGLLTAHQEHRPQGYIWAVELPEVEVPETTAGMVDGAELALAAMEARIASMETQLSSKDVQLAAKDNQIDQLHHLLAQTALNPAPAHRSWWRFWS